MKKTMAILFFLITLYIVNDYYTEDLRNEPNEYHVIGWKSPVIDSLNSVFIAKDDRGRFKIWKDGAGAELRDYKRIKNRRRTLVVDVYGYSIDSEGKIYVYGYNNYLIVDTQKKQVYSYFYGAKTKWTELVLTDLESYDYEFIQINDFIEFSPAEQEILIGLTKKPNFRRPYVENISEIFEIRDTVGITYMLINKKEKEVVEEFTKYMISDDMIVFGRDFRGKYIKIDLLKNEKFKSDDINDFNKIEQEYFRKLDEQVRTDISVNKLYKDYVSILRIFYYFNYLAIKIQQ
jgi:hypothetical protein